MRLGQSWGLPVKEAVPKSCKSLEDFVNKDWAVYKGETPKLDYKLLETFVKVIEHLNMF